VLACSFLVECGIGIIPEILSRIEHGILLLYSLIIEPFKAHLPYIVYPVFYKSFIIAIIIIIIIIIINVSNIPGNMKSRNYRKQPYWALHTYFGKY
jgi:hypothetical protein